METVVSLVVADHQQLFAEGLAMILDAEDDFAVLGVAHDSRRAVELAATHRPAVLLLDAHLPGDDLGATLAAVKTAAPATKLLLAGDARRETIAVVTASGADGFLAKDRSSRQVANAIRTVVGGQRTMLPAASANPSGRHPSVELARIRTLSRREREILGLLASGWSNQRIAQECCVSLHGTTPCRGSGRPRW